MAKKAPEDKRGENKPDPQQTPTSHREHSHVKRLEEQRLQEQIKGSKNGGGVSR
jgi:hypothetical protein